MSTFANGIARVNFSPSFSGQPTVTATVEGAPEPFTITVKNVGPGSFEVNTWRRDTAITSWAFSFIAIGPR